MQQCRPRRRGVRQRTTRRGVASIAHYAGQTGWSLLPAAGAERHQEGKQTAWYQERMTKEVTEDGDTDCWGGASATERASRALGRHTSLVEGGVGLTSFMPRVSVFARGHRTWLDRVALLHVSGKSLQCWLPSVFFVLQQPSCASCDTARHGRT